MQKQVQVHLVQQNCSAQLLLFGSDRMTKLFSAEHRTFRPVICVNYFLSFPQKYLSPEETDFFCLVQAEE